MPSTMSIAGQLSGFDSNHWWHYGTHCGVSVCALLSPRHFVSVGTLRKRKAWLCTNRLERSFRGFVSSIYSFGVWKREFYSCGSIDHDNWLHSMAK
eukprot:c30044_g1_i1 orf=116-403(+)